MSTAAVQYRAPVISESVPWDTKVHLQYLYQQMNQTVTAFALQNKRIGSLESGSTTTNTIVEGGSGGGGGSSSITGIAVNNQSGQTVYATMQGDNGTLVLFSDASPIAVSLTTQTPPWGFYVANIGALGSGTVTLTPAIGTINGAGTLAILPTYWALVAFDGTNWFAATLPIVPVTAGPVAHEWLNSYNGTTGAFTQTQPAFTDISGTATTAQIGTGTPSAGEYVDGGTGAWTALPILGGTSASMGGSPLIAGQTITANVTVTGATTSMVATCSPQTYPGDGTAWDAYVSAANTVTVRLTAVIALTPTASAYNVRVLK